MKRRARGVAIVIGTQGEATREVVRMLGPFFEKVFHASDEDHVYGRIENELVRLVVMMGLDGCKANHDSLREIRHAFPSAKILGLLDAFCTDQEAVLRTAGVVFLGSYERFACNSRSILTKALNAAIS
ncbi:MAG TPA: hypothetical protein VLL97_09965 [Acidobacteriota bacterium]|nr:hypothetical protein [Acidobacteriota bacterium]